MIGAAGKLDMRDAADRARRIDKTLYRRLRNSLTAMEKELLQSCDEAGTARMRSDVRRVIGAGGKRLRPSLACLCGNADAAVQRPLRVVPLMCMLESMHTASLIHDDVVDGATARRGVASINASSGGLAAVQSGDFLLAKAMERLEYYRGTGINEMLAAVSAEMCHAELRQQRVRYEPDAQDEAFCYALIRGKTASLLSASCGAGALAGGLAEDAVRRLGFFGERFGLAFQILDDVLDYRAEEAFGRPSGQDLRNGVLTLPALLCGIGRREALRRLFAKRNKTKRELGLLVEHVRGSDALERAAERIALHCEEALDALAPLREGAERHALTRLAMGLAERAHSLLRK
ncbi:MAG: polyprenyl synthetase family protein [Clostridiales Family XIII bacterium]|jgi:geranylgeranyl pyrophosphate synthase|nr:polyprenyl synthetase family protein [Clostridiales Family XIII bacterium]